MPVEGVAVVAELILYHADTGEGSHGSVLEEEEAVTGKEGRYAIAGWGPGWRPSFRYLDYRDPRLPFLKKGYQ